MDSWSLVHSLRCILLPFLFGPALNVNDFGAPRRTSQLSIKVVNGFKGDTDAHEDDGNTGQRIAACGQYPGVDER